MLWSASDVAHWTLVSHAYVTVAAPKLKPEEMCLSFAMGGGTPENAASNYHPLLPTSSPSSAFLRSSYVFVVSPVLFLESF